MLFRSEQYVSDAKKVENHFHAGNGEAESAEPYVTSSEYSEVPLAVDGKNYIVFFSFSLFDMKI